MTASTRRVLDIVLWSSLSNMVLLGAFFVGWNFEKIRTSVTQHIAGALPVATAQAGALTPVTGPRGDNELFTEGPQRQLKGELRVTAVAVRMEDGAEPEGNAASEPEFDVASGAEVPQADVAAFETGPEGQEAQGMSPVLRRDRRSGKLEIGNFETVSLVGDASQCLQMGYTMLEDTGAPQSSLEVLAKSRSITMARICAVNGAVIITCRSNQLTVSPRRLKPNETCSG